MSTDIGTTECTCKIGKGIEYHDRQELHDEITRQYRDQDKSLRDLESFINREFAAAAVQNADTYHRESSSIKTTPDDIVRILHSTDDTVSPREKARVETELRQAGVYVDELKKRFVSYRTVKNHLNDCVDVDTSRNESITIDSARKTIGWARSRCEGVIEKTIERLSNAGLVTTGADVEVTVTPRVTCDDCGVSVTISEFLRRAGCDCESPDDTSTSNE